MGDIALHKEANGNRCADLARREFWNRVFGKAVPWRIGVSICASATAPQKKAKTKNKTALTVCCIGFNFLSW